MVRKGGARPAEDAPREAWEKYAMHSKMLKRAKQALEVLLRENEEKGLQRFHEMHPELTAEKAL